MVSAMKGLFRIGAVPLFLGCAQLALSADLEFGKPGDPIKLVVGHPSHYTATWSVHVLHGKEFWKKYLPVGSTVEYQTGLAGAVIVNNMLAGKQYSAISATSPRSLRPPRRRPP